MKKITLLLLILSLSFGASAIGVGSQQTFTNVKNSNARVLKNTETKLETLKFDELKVEEVEPKKEMVSFSLVDLIVKTVFDFVKAVFASLIS
jgi:hypothetical protein